MMRVYEVADECGVDVSFALRALSDMGEYVRSGSSTLSRPVILKLRDALQNLHTQNPLTIPDSFGKAAALEPEVSSQAESFPYGPLILGKYELLQSKSQGGLATVHKALDRFAETERFVAVKIIEPLEDAVVTQSLYEHEVKSLKKLQGCRNVVSYIESGFDKGQQRFCIVLEWLEQTLEDYLKDQGPVRHANLWVQISAQIIQAVEDAHKRGIEHRDLKPSNIMVRDIRNGVPSLALIDFGIAKQHDSEPNGLQTMRAFRTPIYSPIDFDNTSDYVRDIYGIAVVMLRLLQDQEFSDQASVAAANSNLESKGPGFAPFKKPLNAVLRPQQGREIVSISAFREILQDARYADGQVPRQAIYLHLSEVVLRKAQSEIGQDLSKIWLETTLNAGPTFVSFRIQDGRVESNRLSIQIDDLQIRCGINGEGSKEHLFVIGIDAINEAKSEALQRLGKVLDLRAFRAHIVEDSFSIPQTASLQKFLTKIKNEPSKPAAETLVVDRFRRWRNVLDARKDYVLNHAKPIKYEKLQILGRELSLDLVDQEVAPSALSSWVVEGFPRATLELVSFDEGTAFLASTGVLPKFPESGKLLPSLGGNAPSLKRQQDAITNLSDPSRSSTKIARVIANPASASISALSQELEFISSNLDEDKRAAVELGLMSEDICVVQGPPGTGKTTFITELIQQFLERSFEQKRVLLVSQTNVAVDNALEKLEKSGVDSLLRVGRENKVSDRTAHLLLGRKIQKWAAQAQKKSRRKLQDLIESVGYDIRNVEKWVLYIDLLESLGRKAKSESEKPNLKTSLEEQLLAIEDDQVAELDTDTVEILKRLESYGLSKDQLELLTNPSEVREQLKQTFEQNPGLEHVTKLARLQKSWNLKFPHDSELQRRVAEQTSVIAGTCVGFLSDKNVREMDFDLCIIDEASKATATELLVPLSKSARAVIVGDSNQLPPIDDEMLRDPEFLKKHGLTPDIVRRSLFDELSEELPIESQIMLSTQYRMAEPIGNLVSEIYYKGKLKSHPRPEIPGYSTLIGRRVIWYDTSSIRAHEETASGKSFVNQTEVKELCRKVQELIAALPLTKFYDENNPPEILVIAPYQAQVTRLRQELAQRGVRGKSIRVETFDAVQGLESDFVFISITRSNQSGNFGFIGRNHWRRHNVALSRAREGLFIFGDRSFVASGKDGLSTVLKYIDTNPAECEVRSLNV